jgi:hypothetical protein
VASPHKVVKLQVEDVVREGLADGKTYPEILDDVNGELAVRHDGKKGAPPKVSSSALERYIASLPEGTVPALHSPDVASANARLALDFEQRFQARMHTLGEWLTEVDTARLTMQKDGVTIDLGPDWQARKAMMSEERRWLQLFVDLMERLYNAQQVQMFQEAVMEELREADPELAQRVVARLQAKVTTRAAALLGGVA